MLDLSNAEPGTFNFAGVGVHRIPGKTMDHSQLGLFYNNVGTIYAGNQRDNQRHPIKKFDPLYDQNRQSSGRFPPFIMTTDPVQNHPNGMFSPTMTLPSVQNKSMQAPRAVLMSPSLSDSSSGGLPGRSPAKLSATMTSSTTSSDVLSSSLSAMSMNHSRVDPQLPMVEIPPVQAHDIGTPHLSSSSAETKLASPASLLTMSSNPDAHSIPDPTRKGSVVAHLEQSFQHGSYRQSGLDALDMAFWNGQNLYSDEESDSEHFSGTQALPPADHAPPNDSGYRGLPLSTNIDRVASDQPVAEPDSLPDYLDDDLIDNYLESGPELDDPPVSRSSYPSSGSSYDDEAWLSANKRKSQVIPKVSHGPLKSDSSWEPFPVKESLPPVPTNCQGELECRRCHQKILGKLVRSADGLFSGVYHRECLRCVDCDTNLFRTNIFVLNDQTYCSTDFHLRNGSTCHTCGLGIDGMYRLARDNTCYHMNCFVCTYNDPSSGFCRAELDEYYMVQEKPYCEKHARILVKQLYKSGQPL